MARHQGFSKRGKVRHRKGREYDGEAENVEEKQPQHGNLSGHDPIRSKLDRVPLEGGYPKTNLDNRQPLGTGQSMKHMTEGGHDGERDQLPSRKDVRKGPFSLNANPELPRAGVGKRGKG